MPASRPLSPLARETARLLGSSIQLGRREHRWTLREMATRVGVSTVTMRRVERGDPSVGLGVALEAAVLAGVPLFDPDPLVRRLAAGRVADRLALLPRAVRQRTVRADDF